MRMQVKEFFEAVGDATKNTWRESSSDEKAKLVVGGGVLVAVVAGAVGYGPFKDRYDIDRYKVGSDMAYSIPVENPGAMGREFLRTAVHDTVMGKDQYSAGQFAISRGMNAAELADLSMTNAKGQRGIFDIPGVDREFAQAAHENVRDLPYVMKPSSIVDRTIGRTMHGEDRDNTRARTLFHERSAEKAWVAGDLDTARSEAALALSGISLLSEGGLTHYRAMGDAQKSPKPTFKDVALR